MIPSRLLSRIARGADDSSFGLTHQTPQPIRKLEATNWRAFWVPEYIFPDQPKLPESVERHVFSTGWRTRAIFIDRKNRQVHFHNCHAPRGFLTSVQPWYTCQADDVLGVHVLVGRRRTQTLTVVTKTGKVTVRGTESKYSELVRSLKKLVPENQHAGLSADHPMMGLVLIFAALLGLFGGGYWGWFYIVGMAFLAIAIFCALIATSGPLLFGGLWSMSLAATGIRLRGNTPLS